MAGLEDVFGRNPHRPNHPDFWRMSEILLGNDGAMDEAPDEMKESIWRDRVASVVDVQSVTYMAVQRALKLSGVNSNPFRQDTPQEVARKAQGAALFIDAFVAGVMFAQRGNFIVLATGGSDEPYVQVVNDIEGARAVRDELLKDSGNERMIVSILKLDGKEGTT